MGFIYVAAISLVGLMLLAVVIDAVTSVSSSQRWPEIRMNAQPATSAKPGELPVQASAGQPSPRAAGQAATVSRPTTRKDEILEAA